MFHKMPFILIAIVAFLVMFQGFIPESAQSFMYALSLTIKSAIIFVLPLVIFMLLFKTLAKLANNATKAIIFILAGVCISNFISTMISYQVGAALYNMDLSIALPQDSVGLEPSWNFSLPKLIANDKAMFAGLFLGLMFSFFSAGLAEKISTVFDKVVNVVLKGIILVIPVFIAGFVVKLIHDKVMQNIVHDYAWIFILVALAQFTYVMFLYLVSSKFNLSKFSTSVQNMLPAGIAGFGSMSSAAAMPLTLVGAEKNTGNPDLTRLTIPATVNIHLIGDCFAIPIFAFAVMKNFGVAEPEFLTYLVFAFYFVLAKFSVAAIPGGGILVMLPILESQLGFTGGMSSMITALYILFDPVITCANVLGNGAFAMILSKIMGKKQETVAETMEIQTLPAP